jgi:hypothetical protein
MTENHPLHLLPIYPKELTMPHIEREPRHSHPPCEQCGATMDHGFVHLCQPPLVRGGQGRSSEDLEEDGISIGWTLLACALLWSGILLWLA